MSSTAITSTQSNAQQKLPDQVVQEIIFKIGKVVEAYKKIVPNTQFKSPSETTDFSFLNKYITQVNPNGIKTEKDFFNALGKTESMAMFKAAIDSLRQKETEDADFDPNEVIEATPVYIAPGCEAIFYKKA